MGGKKESWINNGGDALTMPLIPGPQRRCAERSSQNLICGGKKRYGGEGKKREGGGGEKKGKK